MPKCKSGKYVFFLCETTNKFFQIWNFGRMNKFSFRIDFYFFFCFKLSLFKKKYHNASNINKEKEKAKAKEIILKNYGVLDHVKSLSVFTMMGTYLEWMFDNNL